MKEKLANLQTRLAVLTFAQVTWTKAPDDELFYFVDADGFSNWREEPGFVQRRLRMTDDQWFRTEKSYHFYYGFAQSQSKGSIHFDKGGHRHESESYSGLGVASKQFAMEPPPRGKWIVGIVEPGKKGQHFRQWARCTEAEKLLAEFALRGQTRFSVNDLNRLIVERPFQQGESTNRLRDIALLALARDIASFLHIRTHCGGNAIDDVVYDICQEFDPELWTEYEKRARAQKLSDFFKYSDRIPAPSPKVSVQLREEAQTSVADFNPSPFAGLTIAGQS